MWLVRAQKDVSLLESVTSAIRNTLGRLVGTGEGPSPDEQVAAAWARVDQKKDQVSPPLLSPHHADTACGGLMRTSVA
jgi:hypothetical protein